MPETTDTSTRTRALLENDIFVMTTYRTQGRERSEEEFKQLGLTAGLPLQYPSHRLAVPLTSSQNLPARIGTVVTMVLHGHLQQCPVGVVRSTTARTLGESFLCPVANNSAF